MSEDERRGRERTWQAQGGVEAEAAHLAEELRAGRLAPELCEIAALVGWPAARVVLGRRAPPLPRTRAALTRWVARLHRWGPRVLARALVAIGRARLARDPEAPPWELLPLERRSGAYHLGQVERWILGDLERLQARSGPGVALHPGHVIAQAAFGVAVAGRLLQPVRALHLDARDLEAVRAEVGAWALGREDAVAERCSHEPPPTPPDPQDVDHHRAFLRLVGGPRSLEDIDD